MQRLEATLQKSVEQYLKLVGLTYVHIPASIQRYIWAKSSRVPIHIAAEASRAFKGVPDLMIFGGAGRCLVMELKAPKGKLTPEQAKWERLGLVVCRTVEDAVSKIEDFRNLRQP